MYGIVNYNPYAPAKSTPPTSEDIPPAVFDAARVIHATHLSADGQLAYREKMGKMRVYYWDNESKAFGSSFPCDGLPPGGVKVPDSGVGT